LEKWILLATHGPYSAPLLYEKMQFITTLLDRGDEVILFLYLDGVHLVHLNQYPLNLENVGSLLNDLLLQYPSFQILACSRCAAARGYVDMSKSDQDAGIFFPRDCLDRVKIVSVRDFGKKIAEGYRLIQLV
jgi:sulfur relay (sulfurtransferase) complex TusBCD TusD component (DsrE family)